MNPPRTTRQTAAIGVESNDARTMVDQLDNRTAGHPDGATESTSVPGLTREDSSTNDRTAERKRANQMADEQIASAANNYDADSFEWRGIRPDGTPDEDMIEKMTRAIVKAVDPERIILFGSAARGQMKRDSDLDVLVIKDGEDHWNMAWNIHTCIPRRTRPVDIVVATNRDIERHRGKPYYVIEPALREGRVLYDKATLT